MTLRSARSKTKLSTSTSTSVVGGREDCWSEGATATLIDSWGDRYLRLNRGNLRQKDWQEVSDAVNRREEGMKPRKSGVQCKHRIDTLKKKYKVEKVKPAPSRWPFFNRLDSLVGAGSSDGKKGSAVKHKKGVALTESSFKGCAEEEADCDEVRKENRVRELGFSDEAACRELARAILKFGEVYERTETSKQKQMKELERQRLEFTKDLEFQRMNMFVDTQLEMEKLKRRKMVSQTGKQKQ